MSIPDVEERLIKELKTQVDIWYGKRVVTKPSSYPIISTNNFSSLIFVSKQYQLQKDWAKNGAQAFPNLNLAPITTNYGEEKAKKYEDLIPEIIKNSNYSNLYISVISIYDGLNVYFKFSNENFKNLYNSIIESFSIVEWREISYSLLSKLSSFKGNQTYGGEQYTLNILNHKYTKSKFNIESIYLQKFNNYRTLSSIIIIESIYEKDNTILYFKNDAFPDIIKNIISELFSDIIHEKIVEYSDTVVDYTIFSIAFRKAILKLYPGRKIKFKPDQDQFNGLIKSFLIKIQDLKYSRDYLLNIYQWLGINFINDAILPPYIDKVTDEICEWWTIISKQTEPFNYKPLSLKDNYQWINFKTSQLISYLFINDAPFTQSVKPVQSTRSRSESRPKGESNTLRKKESITKEKLQETFVLASKYQTKTKFQITEIAINEGTTKDFISASLIELVQNSVDAIRSTNAIIRDIYITYANTDNTFTIMVEDFVGMPPQAFLYIGIPFLSTKKPSELVTGEMGSGFFNVYRESSLVTIDSKYEGIYYNSYDIPIIDKTSARVIDIDRNVTIFESPKPKLKNNGTKIMIRSKELNEIEISEYLGLARYTAERILSQVAAFNDIRIFNNGISHEIHKKLMFTIGYFDVYFYEKKSISLPSYIFTKGIPFTPLSNFYTEYGTYIRSEIENGILINIRHGGYTPVQSRTRLNIPDEAKKQFEILLNYIIFVKSMYLVLKDFNRWAWIYPSFKSKAYASQLNQTQLSVKTLLKEIHNYFMYTNFDLLQNLEYNEKNTIVYHTNQIIKFVKDEKITSDLLEKLRTEINKWNLSEFPEVKSLGIEILLAWTKNKNSNAKEEKTGKTTGEKKEKERDILPDEPDNLMGPYIRLWLETFCNKAILLKIHGWNKDTVKKINVLKSDENEYASGWFNSNDNSITINTIKWKNSDKETFINSIKNVKTDTDFQTIGGKYTEYFSFRYPSTTGPHELEHARRHGSHDSAGSHDFTRLSLWTGDISIERTFDQSANTIFSRVLGDGFYESLLLNYKKSNLI
jgi:hypothetical protein